MKKCLFLVSVVGLQFAQSQEFEVFENGLIYSPEAIESLTRIVAAEESAFRLCEWNKQYYSLPQARGILFDIPGNPPQSLLVELENGLTPEALSQKYSAEQLYKPTLITRTDYTDREGNSVVAFRAQPDEAALTVPLANLEKRRFGRWLVGEKRYESTRLLYLDSDFEMSTLPEYYSRKVQFAECMVDTTATIYFNDAWEDMFSHAVIEKFSQAKMLAEKQFSLPRPAHNQKKEETVEERFAFYKSFREWQNNLRVFIEKEMSKSPKFMGLLREALEEAKVKGKSTEELEYYVGKLISMEEALRLKRNRKVVGGCSMDSGPRDHALQIAKLSAETHNWEIFLRAHLNILNDNVSRVSDGSWAWDERGTYIKELEALNINLPDLIYGITFRVSNPASNHYFGSIGRLGRALAESKDYGRFEQEIEAMIKDRNLDDYNRMLCYYLYANMTYHCDTSEEKEVARTKAEKAKTWLPEYLREISD